MSVETRHKQILTILKESNSPIVARKLAEKFEVSRQVIVGYIALLRAAGEEILSTPKGYILNTHLEKEVKKRLVCKHSIEETGAEIQTIIDLGGKLLDVSVEHPVYGEITGTLNIFDQADADQFIQKLKSGETSLLLELTEGVHVHTIAASNIEIIELIEQDLMEKGLLYE